jgi:hypothetical protein
MLQRGEMEKKLVRGHLGDVQKGGEEKTLAMRLL